MQRFKFEMELIFDDEQMEIINQSYRKQEGFTGTVADFVETLAQVGVCTTLLNMAKNL